MTNRGSHITRLKLLIAAPFVCCLFFTACENTEEELNALSQKRIAVEEAKFIESYLSQGGKMKAKLTAPVMLRYQTDSPYIEFPKSLHVDFFNDSLKVESQLNALYGRYRETEQKVFLRDSVTVFNIRKDTLRCKELWWDQTKQIFYTEKEVEIHQPDKVIYGTGLEADQSFNWYLIKQITGQVLVPKGGFNGPPADSTAAGTVAADSVGMGRKENE
ncbi:LPS export ABC transporter periplasmic protein LptC [Flavihumibacter stibioxidans]|uniref:LPS export ABC transporter periplasmic protein LptC n=1 Tax=Flavihumibacter stibioxidans TaxID=1834163 RepID=A0ABR7MA16_9BACT|nr:LPS export ABC transporter periplasmic protein LptC [Flavihumibacter stibioxidans]MBC6491870.1 LPS export ABC transporter periplasmic protein LptC [Flavihumibacter stibioxidans]